MQFRYRIIRPLGGAFGGVLEIGKARVFFSAIQAFKGCRVNAWENAETEISDFPEPENYAEKNPTEKSNFIRLCSFIVLNKAFGVREFHSYRLKQRTNCYLAFDPIARTGFHQFFICLSGDAASNNKKLRQVPQATRIPETITDRNFYYGAHYDEKEHTLNLYEPMHGGSQLRCLEMSEVFDSYQKLAEDLKAYETETLSFEDRTYKVATLKTSGLRVGLDVAIADGKAVEAETLQGLPSLETPSRVIDCGIYVEELL